MLGNIHADTQHNHPEQERREWRELRYLCKEYLVSSTFSARPSCSDQSRCEPQPPCTTHGRDYGQGSRHRLTSSRLSLGLDQVRVLYTL